MIGCAVAQSVGESLGSFTCYKGEGGETLFTQFRIDCRDDTTLLLQSRRTCALRLHWHEPVLTR